MRARCLRFLLIPAAALLCAVAASAPAHAHGGAFGPPPPPEAKGPRGPGGGSGPPTHVDPGFGGPIVTPGSGGPSAPGRVSKRTTPITPTFETSWQLWWSLNREAWLPLRRRGSGAAVTPDATGGRGAAGWEAERRAIARDTAVPFLLALLEPGAKQPDDVVASAAIALGKIAHDKAAIPLLFSLVLDERRSALVRESAALALGHLRRDDPALRLPVRTIEGVRARLLQVFDGHVGGAKVSVPVRTRAFAMYALALLGDQPFQDDPLSRDGRLLSKLLWERLGVPYPDRELHVALLAALGRQPRAGIPDGVHDALRAIVTSKGKTVHGHRWDAFKRAHATTALARLGGVGGHALLLRVAGDRRRSIVVRLGAAIAIAERAPHLAAAERSAALRVMRLTFGLEQELLGVGLATIALGRMVGADLAAGSTRVLAYDKADTLLLQRVERAPWYLKGFAALGLALAAREGDGSAEAVRVFRAKAGQLLLRMARDGRAQTSVRGAAAVGLGLLGDPAAGPALLALARRATLHEEIRAHAALALGQIGAPGGAVEALSDLAVAQTTPDLVRGHAALALALVGEAHVAARLGERLGSGASTRRLASTARALGRLGNLGAAAALQATAGDAAARPLVRAMALVGLGRLLDPAPRPSLLRLTIGACYPARSRAMQEAFTIL